MKIIMNVKLKEGYEKWKNLQLNFDPTEMLRG